MITRRAVLSGMAAVTVGSGAPAVAAPATGPGWLSPVTAIAHALFDCPVLIDEQSFRDAHHYCLSKGIVAAPYRYGISLFDYLHEQAQRVPGLQVWCEHDRVSIRFTGEKNVNA